MQKTSIEWCRNEDGTPGYTWNPVTGCRHGCSYCYGRRIATRFKGTKAWPNGFEPTFHENRLSEPFRVKKPSRIFVCSMADLFGDWVPRSQILWVLNAVRMAEWHTFIFLTKNPKRLAEFNPWPKNCWVGASVDYSRRLSALYVNGWKDLQARVKFISFEPLLQQMYLSVADTPAKQGAQLATLGVNWVIIGAQSQPTKLPERAWVEDIEQAADAAGVKVFEKDSLAPLFPERSLRQEWPQP